MRGRTARSSDPLSLARSLPSKRTSPDVGCGICISARPVVDLPQPDSPTSPSVSPSLTSRLTSETAWTFRPVEPTGNSTTRFSARNKVSDGERRCAVPLPAIGSELLRGGGRDRDRHRSCGGSLGLVAGQRFITFGRADGEPAPVVVARVSRTRSAVAPRSGTCPARTDTEARSCSPCGGCTRSGGRPGIASSFVWLRYSSLGIEFSSASV